MLAKPDIEIGDIVRRRSIVPGGRGHEELGLVGEVKRVWKSPFGSWKIDIKGSTYDDWNPEELELLNGDWAANSVTFTDEEQNMLDQLINKIEGEDMNIRQDLKNLKLSADDRLLLESGVIREDGTPTEEGASILWPYILEYFKDTLVADLRTLKANEASDVNLKVGEALESLKTATKK